jgi:hypothetical protein
VHTTTAQSPYRPAAAAVTSESAVVPILEMEIVKLEQQIISLSRENDNLVENMRDLQDHHEEEVKKVVTTTITTSKTYV